MTERDEPELTRSERAARDAVRGLAPPRPDDAFRTRLRHEFMTGRIGRRRGLPSSQPWIVRGLMLAPLATSLVVVALLLANRGPDWRVLSANGDGRVVVDGTAFAPGERAAMAARLERGARVTVEGAVTLDLVAPGVAALALGPGADVTLPAAPNRWWWRGMTARVAAGNAYFSTGREFPGAQLDVSTPEATVRATGTSFAVLCGAFGTCVCVMEGRVRVGGRAAAPGAGVEVPHGMRRVVHPDQVAETLPILDDSVHELHRQLAAAGGVLER